MGPTGNKASDPERRVSTRASVRISVDHGDGDDDYDYAAAGMVADGFRPPQHNGGAGEPSTTVPSTVPSTPSLTSASSATLFAEESPASHQRPSPNRPSSIPKPPNPHSAMAARPDSDALSRQTTNSAESSGYFHAESPYQGPSGPAHPYQMYPQTVRPARTLSTTTASTMPISESSYRGPRGPSHPYALYSQTGAVEAEAAQPAAIPIGFRGLPDQYQRRVGPDGEEVADMIGPDGHTEQLPPYSRYPDEAYVRKAAAVDGAPPPVVHGAMPVVPPIVTATPAAIPAIPGAGGLGLATRNPEYESTDDLGSPRSRHSSRSFVSDDSGRGIRLDDEPSSEKRQPPKRWQTWMRRKLWGIVPYWAICLTGLVFLLMAAILGAVVGTLLPKQKRPQRKEGAWEPTFFDATPIPVPTDLPPLPTGTFAMPLLANRVSNTCFKNPALSQAWNCHLVISGMQLTVIKDGADYRAGLDCNRSYTLSNNVYSYGEQPPLLHRPVPLDLVSDKFEPGRGPAWFKMLPYNKTVILPEGWLGSSGNSERKARHVASISAGISNFKRKGIAQRGDKPWICNWPNTYLEIFIYAQQNSSYSNWGPKPVPASLSSSSTEASTSPMSSSSPPPPPPPTTTTPPPATSPPPPPRTPPTTTSPDLGRSRVERSESSAPSPFNQPFNGFKSNYYFPNGPASKSTSKSKGYPMNLAYVPDNDEPPPPTHSTTTTVTVTPPPSPATTTSDSSSSSSSSSTITTSPTTTTPTPTDSSSTMPNTTSPFGPIDTGDGAFLPFPQPYPRVVKVEERRVSTAGAPRAQCTQVEIQGPGEEARVLRDEDGRPVVVEIEETEPFRPSSGGGGSPGGDMARRAAAAAVVVERGDGGGGGGGGGVPDISPCGCMWYLT